MEQITLKTITLIAQYILTIQMDIWDIVVIMDGVCGLKRERCLIPYILVLLPCYEIY